MSTIVILFSMGITLFTPPTENASNQASTNRGVIVVDIIGA